jgi:hypothetical protein
MARRSRPEDLAAARLSGIARRHAGKGPEFDVEAALAELRAVPAVDPDKLAETAGIALGYHQQDTDFDFHALEAALLIAAGADLTRLRHWMRVGAERRAIRPLEAR